MHLFDPQRPKLPNQRPAWIRNHIAVDNFQIFPLENGNIEISIWLPIKDSTFASMRFTKEIEPISLHGLIQNFINDPEQTCEFLFQQQPNEAMEPQLRNQIRYETNPDETTRLIKQSNNSKSKPVGPLNLEF